MKTIPMIVATAILLSANVGFALPTNSVKSAINSVVKTVKIVRPFIGIRFQTITPEIKAKYNLSVDYGLLVQKGASVSEPAIHPEI